MSQLTAPTHTLADSIPLGRRITEIMAEKGPAYTIAAMAKRLDINRETLRLMLKGEREIYTFELEKIAHDLKVPVERILQSDIAEESRRLRVLLQTWEDFDLCIELAEKIAAIAIGLTERVMTENERIMPYYRLRRFDYAYEMYTKLLKDAELLIEKYNDPEAFLRVVLNIITAKAALQDYTDLQELIEKTEPYFGKDPKSAAIMCQSIAKMKELDGDIEGAREKYYQALDIYKSHCYLTSLATAQSNVAVFEYHHGNYEKAYELQELVFQAFSNHIELYIPIVMTRYRAKIMMQWNRMPEAIKLILGMLDKIRQEETDYSNLEAELNLLLAIATEDQIHVETNLQRQIGSPSIQKLSVKFLIDICEQKGDFETKSKYERHMRNMRISPIDKLLPGGKGTPYLMLLHDFCLQHNWHL